MTRFLIAASFAGLVLASPCPAGVTLGIDLATLNELLPALAANEIQVPLPTGQTVGVRLENLRVNSLEPQGGPAGTGVILASMRVRIPQLGLDVPVDPQLSLHVKSDAGPSLLELRFEQAQVALPMAGSLDIATFLPPLRFPAEYAWRLAGAAGNVELKSKLTSIEMGRNVLRLAFDVDAGPGK